MGLSLFLRVERADYKAVLCYLCNFAAKII